LQVRPLEWSTLVGGAAAPSALCSVYPVIFTPETRGYVCQNFITPQYIRTNEGAILRKKRHFVTNNSIKILKNQILFNILAKLIDNIKNDMLKWLLNLI
jgi:hypothetical protein